LENRDSFPVRHNRIIGPQPVSVCCPCHCNPVGSGDFRLHADNHADIAGSAPARHDPVELASQIPRLSSISPPHLKGSEMNSQDSSGSPLQQARTLLRSRQIQQAIDLLQNLPELSKSEDGLLLHGTACFRAGQLEAARSSFESLTRDFPHCIAGWVNLGAALNKMGEHKKAVEIFRRAVQKDRRCADAWYNMGIAQRALKMQTMAISAWKEALKINPDFADAHLQLARTYSDMKNLGLAQKCLHDVLRLQPESARAKAMLAEIQEAQKAARSGSSPFGRLVDLEALQQKANTAPRVLTPPARDAEREMLQNLTKPVRQAARDLAPLLAESFQQKLHRLERIIVDTGNRSHSPEALEELAKQTQEIHDLLAEISSAASQIRKHLGHA
jgi:tetratricopeptide (TPR) repeat protein